MKPLSAHPLLAAAALLGGGLLSCGAVFATPPGDGPSTIAFSCNGLADAAPPTLNGISVSGVPNALVAGTFVSVTLNMSDNCSGLRGGVINVMSPTGKQHFGVATFILSGAPTNLVSTQRLGNGRQNSLPVEGNGFPTHFYRWSERGTWTVSGVTVIDYAGNATSYNSDELAALGNNRFFVGNARGDTTAPALSVGSAIETPTVSLGSAAPIARAALRFADSGNPTPSGLDVADAIFCLNPTELAGVLSCDDSISLVVNLGVPLQSGTVRVEQRLVSAQFSDPSDPGKATNPKIGTYELCSVDLFDLAGNIGSFQTLACLGTAATDAMFPLGTRLTITP